MGYIASGVACSAMTIVAVPAAAGTMAAFFPGPRQPDEGGEHVAASGLAIPVPPCRESLGSAPVGHTGYEPITGLLVPVACVGNLGALL